MGYTRSYNILKRLCLHSKAAKMLALRELLERSLFTKDKLLFGAKIESHTYFDSSAKLLLEQNRKNVSLTFLKVSLYLHYKYH